MSRPRTVAFATSRAYATLTADDRLALPALEARGIDVRPAVWNDPSVDWSAFDAVVIRSTWDYFHHVDAFAAWVRGLDAVVARGTRVLNAPALLAWNLDKRYLRELAARGIAIPETAWVEDGASADLGALLDAHGWDACVVKPAVSGGAFETSLVARADAAAHQPALDALARRGAVMVQRFLPGVPVEGEWSLLFFGGAFSHAVRKRPKSGDFRVQHEHGGVSVAEVPPRWLVDAAHAVLDAIPPSVTAEPPLYARVDGVVEAGRFLLMELEALEPALFFATDARAPHAFAEAVGKAVRGAVR